MKKKSDFFSFETLIALFSESFDVKFRKKLYKICVNFRRFETILSLDLTF